MKLADLRPGERFTTGLGDTWRLERHDGAVSWAVRVVSHPTRAGMMNGGPVPVGERDRFNPRVHVELVGAQKALVA